jgi:hypothetical protein
MRNSLRKKIALNEALNEWLIIFLLLKEVTGINFLKIRIWEIS